MTAVYAARAMRPTVGRMPWPKILVLKEGRLSVNDARLIREEFERAGPGQRIQTVDARTFASDPPAKPCLPMWCASVYVSVPPSIAAWRLAWWLKDARLHPDAFVEALGVRGMGLRLLNGEVDPCEALAERIARRTEGFVRPEHWARACGHAWLDDAGAVSWSMGL